MTRLLKLSEPDRERALSFLSDEPQYNFFLRFDIMKYGFNSGIQDVWVSERRGGIEALLLRYVDNYLLYSKSDDYSAEPVISQVISEGASCVMGKASVIDRLADRWDHNSPDIRASLNRHLVSTLENAAERRHWPPWPGGEVVRAGPGHVDDIISLHSRITEFDTRQRSESARKLIGTAISDNTGRYLCVFDHGRIAAVAGSAAETDESAAIVGVATSPELRRRGYATWLVGTLCGQLLDEGRKFCVLFYENPDAGRIYKRLGFKPAGTWGNLKLITTS